jgi:hypothetical protein
LELGFSGAPGQAWFGIFTRADTSAVEVRQFAERAHLIIGNNVRLRNMLTGGNLENFAGVAADQFYTQQIQHFKQTKKQ